MQTYLVILLINNDSFIQTLSGKHPSSEITWKSHSVDPRSKAYTEAKNNEEQHRVLLSRKRSLGSIMPLG